LVELYDVLAHTDSLVLLANRSFLRLLSALATAHAHIQRTTSTQELALLNLGCVLTDFTQQAMRHVNKPKPPTASASADTSAVNVRSGSGGSGGSAEPPHTLLIPPAPSALLADAEFVERTAALVMRMALSAFDRHWVHPFASFFPANVCSAHLFPVSTCFSCKCKTGRE
jgi:hypothetical protein